MSADMTQYQKGPRGKNGCKCSRVPVKRVWEGRVKSPAAEILGELVAVEAKLTTEEYDHHHICL